MATRADDGLKLQNTTIKHAFVFHKQLPLLDPGKFFTILSAKGFTYQMQSFMELDQATGAIRKNNLGLASRDTGAVGYDPAKGIVFVTNEATFGLLPSQIEGGEAVSSSSASFHPVNSSIEDLELVHEILTKQLEVVLSKSIQYVECVFETFVVGKKAPLVALNHRLSGDLMRELSALIGEDVAPFSVRVAPKSHLYTEMNLKRINNWYDLRVEPLIANPKQYYINFVYRNESYELYLNFVRNLERVVTGAIRALEKD